VRSTSGHAADQRVDLAVLGLFVEVDGELLERAFVLALVALGRLLFLGALGSGGLDRRTALADAVRDEADRVEAAHILLLQEIDRIGFALAEQGNQHVGAGHFVAARRLDVQDRALDDALEPAGRRGIGRLVDLERIKLGVEILRDGHLELVEIDAARCHHLGGMFVIDQRKQQMLERRIFVAARRSGFERLVEGGFERGGETRH